LKNFLIFTVHAVLDDVPCWPKHVAGTLRLGLFSVTYCDLLLIFNVENSTVFVVRLRVISSKGRK
jgi:hypothetical protein